MHSRIFCISRLDENPNHEYPVLEEDDFYGEGIFGYNLNNVYDYVDEQNEAGMASSIAWLNEYKSGLVEDDCIVLSEQNIKKYFEKQYEDFTEAIHNLARITYDEFIGLKQDDNGFRLNSIMYDLKNSYESTYEFYVVINGEDFEPLDYFMRHGKDFTDLDKNGNIIPTKWKITKVFDYHF